MASVLLVSLIVPFYRNIDTISAALVALSKALLQVDGTCIEIIFVNNNSDDGSDEVVRNFSTPEARVVNVKEIKQGVSNARNAGIMASSGKYIAFLDADDCLDPKYFLDVICGLKTEPDMLFITPEVTNGIKYFTEFSIVDFLDNHLKGWWNWQFVFRKEIASGLKFQGACFEDFGFFPQIVARIRECIVLGRGLYIYNKNPESLTKRSIEWRISELQAQFERLSCSSKELGTTVFDRVRCDYYDHISLLRAIAGKFPVLSVRETLMLLCLSKPWASKWDCAMRLLARNGSTLCRPFKRLFAGWS